MKRYVHLLKNEYPSLKIELNDWRLGCKTTIDHFNALLTLDEYKFRPANSDEFKFPIECTQIVYLVVAMLQKVPIALVKFLAICCIQRSSGCWVMPAMTPRRVSMNMKNQI
jgi:hypothetical protein